MIKVDAEALKDNGEALKGSTDALNSDGEALTSSLPHMTENSVVIRQCTEPYMTQIPVKFTISPITLDPGMHFILEVKVLKSNGEAFSVKKRR